MSPNVEREVQFPTPGEPFIPGKVFRGIGALVPERVAASTRLSMTAKLCYGHLVRRAGKKTQCWPSYRDIANSIGVGERQAMRALKELTAANLIRPTPRRDKYGRQTSNDYEFIWGPILQREDDKYDTLPPDNSDRVRVTTTTPSGVTDMTPLEVSNRNHHQEKNTERKKPRSSSTGKGSSEPKRDVSPNQNPKPDDDSERTEYASAKDELKAIFQAKTGSPIRMSDLDAIESTLAAAGVTWEAFVAEGRGHAWNSVKNPVGFLKHLSKKFRTKTQLSNRPVTATEAAARDYRCSKCSSKRPGEGAICTTEGNWEPCSCASPEWVDHQRTRGVFKPKGAP
jgi:hypothetical protein